MSTKFMSSFCHNEQLWDSRLTWHTSLPRFSQCFLQTVPVFIPSAFLLLFGPFQIYSLVINSKSSSKESSIPLNRYNVSRFLLVLLIVMINLVQLTHDLFDYLNPTTLHLVAQSNLVKSLLNVVIFALFAFLISLHRIYGVHTSAICLLYTFLSVVLSLPNVYMYVRFYGDETEDFHWNLLDIVMFGIHFVALVILFVLTCFSDNSKEDSKNMECPTERASFLSLMTYYWIDPLILKGFRTSLTLSDIWPLNWRESFEFIGSKFKVDDNQMKFGILGTIGRSFWFMILSSAAYKLVYDLLQFVGPQLIKVFIDFISRPSSSEPVWHGYLYAFMFLFVASIQVIFMNFHYETQYHLGMKVRAGLISAIYRKSLHLSNRSRREKSTGEIVNLMSVDAQRLTDTFPNINDVWSAPMSIGLTVYFLWRELGPSVLAGLLILIKMIPLNGWITSYQRRYQLTQMNKKDERIKVINEVLNGIKVIKLYGWELPFIGKINQIRDSEIAQIRKIAIVKAILSFISTCAPFAVTFVTFAVYVLSSDENVLDAKKAFVSLSLFELLRIPLAAVPDTISSVVMASVALGRLNQFLNSEQLEKYVTREEDFHDSIVIKNGSFSWEKNEANNNATLSGIDMRIKKGSLVAIVGHVGSGKSSFLSAILGDMQHESGTINIAKSESIAYVSQQAWIQHATLRENILFGKEFDKRRYESIIEMCALKPDIAILPDGERTEIGEQGINLSGGQKQRVAIARACYTDASLMLFDDPLSAVDSHVAQHIFQKVLSNQTGYLKKQTRVLVTNSINFLSEVDQIIVLSNGTIQEIGTYQELMENNGKFSEFVQNHSNEKQQQQQTANFDNEPNEKTSNTENSTDLPKSTNEKSSKEANKLIKTETTESGQVKLSVYSNYIRSLTWLWFSLTLIGFIGMQTVSVMANVWLAIWSNDKQHSTNRTIDEIELRNHRLTVYGGLGLAQGCIFLLGAIALAKGTVNSSVALHRALLNRIMRAPMNNFFDTTPLGRIVNRFSKDVDTVDTSIPISVNALLLYVLQVVATIILICMNMPLFLIVVLPIVLLYYFIQKYYVPTSRQLKRLESVTRSPIFSHFSETLSGVSTIRAFGVMGQFVAESNRRVDNNLKCFYPNFITNRWLSLRLKFAGNLIVLLASIFAVVSRDSFRDKSGFIGLIITYSLSVTQSLTWVVRYTSEMEVNIVSVERIAEYCQIETEREWTRTTNSAPKIDETWPKKGEIEFNDFSMQYRTGLELVLNSINIKINAGEKIGIVGRTGAGKSSLTLALFRIIEAFRGRITIDGVEIDKIGLHELRSKLAIIPQDPVLFSGTIRSNLDPFGIYADDKLWEALENSHPKSYIVSLDSGLDHPIAEGGSNLSVGQRQLICLGRALLRATQILVLDEATAAIDLETDSLIQQTIRDKFDHCTVLTIAHRLNTIMDSTRVLVLEQGTVAEFDSPANLLKNVNSKFYSLAKDAGIV